MTTAGYEFTAEQNETLKGLVSNMKRSSVVVALASLILLAYHFIGHFGVTLGAAPPPSIYWIDLAMWILISGIGVAIAILLVRATVAFTAVIHTEGNDVEHLMQGLSGLRRILGLTVGAGMLVSLLLAVSLALLLLYS